MIKITKINGGAATLESNAIALDNYQTVGFLFENIAGTKLTVKVKANKDGGAATAVPFTLEDTQTGKRESIEADGKEITAAGAFLAIITGGNLSRSEYGGAALSLSVDTGEVSGAFALQTNPRYNGDE